MEEQTARDVLDRLGRDVVLNYLPIFLEKHSLTETFEQQCQEHVATQIQGNIDIKDNMAESETRKLSIRAVRRTRRHSSLMSKSSRRSSLLSASFKSTLVDYRSAAPPDLHRVEGVTQEEKVANLSLKLMRIYELDGIHGFHVDKFQVMADSWLEAIKDYMSVNAAMRDWTFAWMLDENADLVKFLVSKSNICLNTSFNISFSFASRIVSKQSRVYS